MAKTIAFSVLAGMSTANRLGFADVAGHVATTLEEHPRSEIDLDVFKAAAPIWSRISADPMAGRAQATTGVLAIKYQLETGSPPFGCSTWPDM
ncbi:MAG: hypothetical protein VR78_04595 [Hoeflea sp. BRH_c9]|nr:MAG: hypothetical protein VR78_04595 [Hoeflea sp. BRH_c9]